MVKKIAISVAIVLVVAALITVFLAATQPAVLQGALNWLLVDILRMPSAPQIFR